VLELAEDDGARRRVLIVLAGAVAVVVLAGTVLWVLSRRDDGPAPKAAAPRHLPTTTTSRRTTSAAPPTTTTTSLVIPPSTGVFDAAPGAGAVLGHGTVHTFRVEVERGSGVDPADFAAIVDGILGDPRGWTAGGGVAFQRVPSGGSFTITLATPNTTDAICLPLHTNNKFSCHEGHRIVVNLRRWSEGTVDLPLSVPDYRANVINHEVGHELGKGHVGCPGPGLRAPVMMQQSKGLLGCIANSWPTLDGT
jgi:hypothetical protein